MPFLDNPLKEARASFCRLRSKGWFAEEFLADGIVLKRRKGQQEGVPLRTRAFWSKFPCIPSLSLLLFAFGGMGLFFFSFL